MGAPKTLLTLGLATSLLAMLWFATSHAGTFGRSLIDALPEMNNTDRGAMERAQRDVLDRMTPGAVSVWRDAKTGHSGEARLLRSYAQNGMSCGEVEHTLKLPGASRYTMRLCRVSDGTWRLAF